MEPERGLSASPVTGRPALGSPQGRLGREGVGVSPRRTGWAGGVGVSPTATGPSHRWKAPRVRRISLFFAEGWVMRPLASDASCRRAHAQAWYALELARQPGLPVKACRVQVRRLLPFAGVGLAWWDRARRRSPAGWRLGVTPGTGSRRFGGFPSAASGSVGVSTRHCGGLTTRGVRVDRVGVAASPGRP